MDAIFAKCNSIFTIVKIAKEEPHRYGKNGELLIKYEDTDMAERRASVLSTRSGEKRGSVARHVNDGNGEEKAL